MQILLPPRRSRFGTASIRTRTARTAGHPIRSIRTLDSACKTQAEAPPRQPAARHFLTQVKSAAPPRTLTWINTHRIGVRNNFTINQRHRNARHFRCGTHSP
ncbi:hypothetical protein G3N57_11135 [Paraburkholderia sp. Se-20369]|nr:hypothetical protein [Paraburkholderia sp. Se-20369]